MVGVLVLFGLFFFKDAILLQFAHVNAGKVSCPPDDFVKAIDALPPSQVSWGPGAREGSPTDRVYMIGPAGPCESETSCCTFQIIVVRLEPVPY